MVAKADFHPQLCHFEAGYLCTISFSSPDHKEAFTRTVSEATQPGFEAPDLSLLSRMALGKHFISLPQCSHLLNVYNTTKLMRLLQGLRELLNVLVTGTCPINTICCFLTINGGGVGGVIKMLLFFFHSQDQMREDH